MDIAAACAVYLLEKRFSGELLEIPDLLHKSLASDGSASSVLNGLIPEPT